MSALLSQVKMEQKRVSDAWQFGFLCGLVLGMVSTFALAVPLTIWIMR